MRNWIWTSIIIGLIGIASAQGSKIAVIDMDKAFEGYNQTKSADAVLQAQAKKFADEKKSMVEEYEKIDEDYNSAREDARKPFFSEEKQLAALDRSEKLLLEKRELESKIRQTETDRKRQLEDQMRRKRKTLVEEIREVIKTYARSRNISMVIDQSGPSMHGFPTVIYADESVDITDEVIALLNEKNP